MKELEKAEDHGSVWLVEDGYYSDYHVLGVFSSQENATKIIEEIGETKESETRIRELKLDQGIFELNDGLHRFYVDMSYEGIAWRVHRVYSVHAPLWGQISVFKATEAFSQFHNVADEVRGMVWAKDAEHAVKIANEFRVQEIAEGRMSFKGDLEKRHKSNIEWACLLQQMAQEAYGTD